MLDAMHLCYGVQAASIHACRLLQFNGLPMPVLIGCKWNRAAAQGDAVPLKHYKHCCWVFQRQQPLALHFFCWLVCCYVEVLAAGFQVLWLSHV